MDDINAQQLARCSGERIVFAAQDVGSPEALAACLVHSAELEWNHASVGGTGSNDMRPLGSESSLGMQLSSILVMLLTCVDDQPEGLGKAISA